MRFKSRRRNFWVYNWWVIRCLNLNLRGSTGRFMWYWYRNWLYRRRHRLWCLWWLWYWNWILRRGLLHRILCLGRRYQTFVWGICWNLLWWWYRCCLRYRLWCIWWLWHWNLILRWGLWYRILWLWRNNWYFWMLDIGTYKTIRRWSGKFSSILLGNISLNWG